MKDLTNAQREELIVDARQEVANFEKKDGGMSRSLLKMKMNQRLTGNDYKRLTAAVILAILVSDKFTEEVAELEAVTPEVPGPLPVFPVDPVISKKLEDFVSDNESEIDEED